jgi:hypothetical protein
MAGIAPGLESGSSLTSYSPQASAVQSVPGGSFLLRRHSPSASPDLTPFAPAHTAQLQPPPQLRTPAVSRQVAKLQLLPALRPHTPVSCSSRPSLHIIPPPPVPPPEPSLKCCPRRRLRFIQSFRSSFLAAWTPPAESLDPRLLQRPSAWHSFVFSKTKLCLLWE